MQPPCLGACGGGGSLVVPVPRPRLFCPGAAPARAPVSCAAGVVRRHREERITSGASITSAPLRKRSGPRSTAVEGARVGAALPRHRLRVEGRGKMQTPEFWFQEPVIKPSWDTFASSLSGNWKGVGAVFSPITAEMEPVGVSSKDEYLYDCYTLSHIEKSFDSVHGSEIRRKTNWVPINPFGEADKQTSAYDGGSLDASDGRRAVDLPAYECFDLNRSNILDEETFAMEPGIVFFEDRNESTHLNDDPCLPRIDSFMCDTVFDLKPFSQRNRTKPSELTGSWKVYEVSATPIFSDEMQELEGGAHFVYLCMETVKKRTLPESSRLFGEEEMLDMQDVTVLWLPGGVTSYVDIDKDGVLCIGVGWYSEEGINLVMERDYGTDGRLREVRSKTEVKRRWNQPIPH
ncbi:hypothetical protein PR202_ga19496 [Eleusine coracana subsp. coracana]|uniref:Uncharacterized protein n=1 Tax=Eleusine coracana subsp. coracana TaxID=191504 RepID=A0AAV5CW70_ELECO|nr:hypothetical protein PR202_ga19496 [Eleusine coracana subsp. coracana]